jgi:poly(3-hydroxybutyrate) depolymerase
MRSLLLLAVLASSATAAPCKRCVLEVPKSDEPVPLIVVLHGDREHASAAATRWRSAVKRRGWALLALECPSELGCKDSFWQWDGDPSWVRDQALVVAGVDPARIYLIGWSGGASYIGARAQAWTRTFAALVFHGGGMAPESDECSALPAYFLVGDRNPLHQLARQLRAYFDGCKAEVVWDVINGADHAKEEAALTAKKSDAILTWLAHHARS